MIPSNSLIQLHIHVREYPTYVWVQWGNKSQLKTTTGPVYDAAKVVENLFLTYFRVKYLQHFAFLNPTTACDVPSSLN